MLVQNILNGISLGSVYALIAVGFALIFNVLKFSNFSQGGVMTVTAYAGYVASRYLSDRLDSLALFAAVLAAAALSGAVIAAAVERLAFRRLRRTKSEPVYYFISSITMGILLENLVTIYASSNFYSYPRFFTTSAVPLFGVNVAVTDMMMFALSITSLLALLFILHRTKIGLGIRAACFDVNTVQLMGMNPDFLVTTALMISGALGGVSGVFLGMNYTLYPQLGQMVVKGFVASVLGGLGSIHGAVIGAVLLGVLEIFFISWVGAGWAPVFVFIVMLAFLLVRPRGIAGIIVQEKA
ncbi:MAG TPA: branched-chain amino acid ABC transporter permease [Aminobacteriaceae bacterium]|nr:branched-chain amino acid ABC transporter permease [Aminobacteriaceae bacterium]